MPRFEIAHVREMDHTGHYVDIIIIPMESSFGDLPANVRQQQIAELQMRAHVADLAGIVCPVWQDSLGRMDFVAPPNWHLYFRSLSIDIVIASINRTLEW